MLVWNYLSLKAILRSYLPVSRGSFDKIALWRLLPRLLSPI